MGTNIPDIILPAFGFRDEDVPFRFFFRCNRKSELINYLEYYNIQTRSFFYPMHLQPAVLHHYPDQTPLPVSEELFSSGIALPLHMDLKDDDVIFICDRIKSFFAL